MIKNILFDAAVKSGFSMASQEGSYSFFKKDSHGAERYLVYGVMEKLVPIDEVHSTILEKTPAEIRARPAFNKNCDLVLIYKVVDLEEYKKIEDAILSYEEDPFHFKKYFLYYTSNEEALVEGKGFSDLVSVIMDQTLFSNYKKNPLDASLYGLIARIFIKMPFLEVPRSEKDLVPLAVEISEELAANNTNDLWNRLSSLENDSDIINDFVQVLINEELENIKNSDTGI